jgi:hypothetical protein
MVNELNGHSDMLRIYIIVYLHLSNATADNEQAPARFKQEGPASRSCC